MNPLGQRAAVGGRASPTHPKPPRHPTRQTHNSRHFANSIGSNTTAAHGQPSWHMRCVLGVHDVSWSHSSGALPARRSLQESLISELFAATARCASKLEGSEAFALVVYLMHYRQVQGGLLATSGAAGPRRAAVAGRGSALFARAKDSLLSR